MISPDTLLRMFQYNADALLTNLDGLTHEQSLWQPTPDVNNINWIVGHLISARTRVLTGLKQAPVWTDDQRARYRHGSARIGVEGGEGVLPLDDLIHDFKLSHEGTIFGFHRATIDLLQGPAEFGKAPSLGDSLLYFQFHEAHHIGQIMLLREQLGLPSTWPF